MISRIGRGKNTLEPIIIYSGGVSLSSQGNFAILSPRFDRCKDAFRCNFLALSPEVHEEHSRN